MTSLPPTRNFFPLRFSPPMIASESERQAIISAEAYLRAERRNFAPGHELDDWLAAEAELTARLSHVRNLIGFAAR
jgi:Protein of unknown function (DUF2934)